MTDSGILRFNRDLLFELETDGTPEGSIVKAPFSGTIPGGGPVLSFDSSVETLIPLIVDINPVQEGSGDPSPSNVRPIIGWDSVNVYVSPTTSAEDGKTTTINLSQTVYGGVLDVVSGKLTIDSAKQLFNGSTSCLGVSANYGSGFSRALYNTVQGVAKKDQETPIISDVFGYTNSSNLALYKGNINGNGILCLGVPDTITTTAQMQTWAGEHPFNIVYKLDTPIEIQLTPTEVKTLIGPNNIWSNSGNVYTPISTEKVTYKITGGAEDVQRFNKIWKSLLLYQDGGVSNKYRNLSGKGDEIISHGPRVLKEE